jgi:hypothetical protein
MKEENNKHIHMKDTLESAHSSALLISAVIIDVFYVLSAMLLSGIGFEVFLASPFIYFLVVSYIGRISHDFSERRKASLDVACLAVFLLNVIIFNAFTRMDPIHSFLIILMTTLIYLFFR